MCKFTTGILCSIQDSFFQVISENVGFACLHCIVPPPEEQTEIAPGGASNYVNDISDANHILNSWLVSLT